MGSEGSGPRSFYTYTSMMESLRRRCGRKSMNRLDIFSADLGATSEKSLGNADNMPKPWNPRFHDRAGDEVGIPVEVSKIS